ncbi:hypothetical protein QZJ86_09380 [Methylomonas montana]|uniref:hypothetical protein n=1 Tax=Methylomonas montana TaxID=3058963 RepID=UPI0026594072|nr:hypothetical protein [Methylomonas montana]WKJ92334.1 hypothetical protein QZJ86_09380 [Methylomonas montana]
MANQACPTGLEVSGTDLSGRQQIAAQAWPMAGASIWRVANGLQLRPVADMPLDDPLWVVQTDRYVLPNHGFMAQKPFWCFIEQTMNLATSAYALN